MIQTFGISNYRFKDIFLCLFIGPSGGSVPFNSPGAQRKKMISGGVITAGSTDENIEDAFGLGELKDITVANDADPLIYDNVSAV